MTDKYTDQTKLSSELPEKKTRTPRNYDNILKGALTLSLAERVNLVKEVKASIVTDVDIAKKAAASAEETVNGL